MAIKKNKAININGMLAFFFCSGLIAGGCAKSTSGYHSVNLNKPGVKIAFEYPAAWDDHIIQSFKLN